MIRKLTFAFLGSILWLCAWAQHKADDLPTEQLLFRLDALIDQKEAIHARRENAADSLKHVASSTTGQERIDALKSLYDHYSSFQTDSTLSAIDRLAKVPEYATDKTLQQYCTLCRARTLGIKGMFTNAYQLVNSIGRGNLEDDMLLQYYNVMHALSDWMSDFIELSAPGFAHQLRQVAIQYHDSIAALEPEESNRVLIRTNALYDRQQYKECVDTLIARMPDLNEGQRIYAYARLGQAYEKIGNEAKAIHYLTLTAIGDIKNGNTEYLALPVLARKLHLQGDNERAYTYLACALKDASFCHANLRTIESTTIYPIIDQVHQEHQQKQRRTTQIFVTLLSIICLLLGIGIFGLWRQGKRLGTVRSALAEANSRLKNSNIKLQNANQQLVATDKIKEEYLLQYLSRSRRYLVSMEGLQRQMYRLLQTKQMEELSKQLHSNQLLAEEQAHFFADFDEAFLKLYPNFIADFNALLSPDAQIVPKRGELLTTELRIFALIRLGETDSNQIAKFLGYSLTTIYNYRSRVRNNAVGDKDLFEGKVMKL